MFRIGKSLEIVDQWLPETEKWEMAANKGHRISFWGDESVLELVMKVPQSYEHTEYTETIWDGFHSLSFTVLLKY